MQMRPAGIAAVATAGERLKWLQHCTNIHVAPAEVRVHGVNVRAGHPATGERLPCAGRKLMMQVAHDHVVPKAEIPPFIVEDTRVLQPETLQHRTWLSGNIAAPTFFRRHNQPADWSCANHFPLITAEIDARMIGLMAGKAAYKAKTRQRNRIECRARIFS